MKTNENQEIIRKFVEKNVIHSCSIMVSKLSHEILDIPEQEVLCDMFHRFDEEGKETEILEHWIITPQLGEKLQEHGEIVGKLYDFTIWGRTISGQAIYADAVMEDICCELGLLK